MSNVKSQWIFNEQLETDEWKEGKGNNVSVHLFLFSSMVDLEAEMEAFGKDGVIYTSSC
jgi:hypothetical protein